MGRRKIWADPGGRSSRAKYAVLHHGSMVRNPFDCQGNMTHVLRQHREYEECFTCEIQIESHKKILVACHGAHAAQLEKSIYTTVIKSPEQNRGGLLAIALKHL